MDIKETGKKLKPFAPVLSVALVTACVAGSLSGYEAPVYAATQEETPAKKEETKEKKEEKKTAAKGSFNLEDGVYKGTGTGYAGDITVSVLIKDKQIVLIDILSSSDDAAFFTRAKAVIDKIIEGQTLDVDTVSGATFSSRGIISAVKNALTGEKDTSETGQAQSGQTGAAAGSSTSVAQVEDAAAYKDGTYYGSGTGFGGPLKVMVEISGGKIASIQIVENSDGSDYISKAASLIDSIIMTQSTNVDTVSGATYSSVGIIQAVRDALGQAAVNGTSDSTQNNNNNSNNNSSSDDDHSTVTGTVPYKEGIYYGTADGYSGDVSVAVVIQEKTIKAILITESSDDEAFFNRAMDVVKKVIRTQKTDDVDTVSGATYSSKGLLNAIKNALKQAEKVTNGESIDEKPDLTDLKELTGCGKNTGQTSRSTEKKEIDIPIILTVDPTSGKKTEQDVVDAFNEEYAGTYHMQVEWIMETEEEYRKNLKRLNVTDELPAVIYDVRTLPSFYQMMVADGRIENLSPYLEEDEEWRNMIEPAVMEGCTDEDGNIYLGPISTAAFACAGMFWNPELFAEAGIEKFPETWEEFWDCCDRLQANGITPLGLHTEGTGWAPMLIATAEAAHTEEGYAFMKELLPESYSNDTGLEIAETLQKLFRYTTEDAIHADYDVAYNNFVAGKVAMIPNGYWMIDQLPEEWKEKVRFSAFPGNKLIASPETFGWAVVSTYSEEVKEGAVEFLKFRTKFNLEEKKELMDKNGRTEISQLLQDYVNAYNNNPQIVPNYQVKWNSILQEETIGECLPQLAAGKMTLAQMVETADESIREYAAER